MTGNLATLADVKSYLGLTVNTDDGLLGRLVSAASSWIKSFLNRDILTDSYTEVLDGTGTYKIMVDQYPITAVSLLVVDGHAVSGSDFVFRQSVISLTNGAKFPRGIGNVVVSYTAGYESVPADINQSCVELAAWRYKEKDRIGHSSKTIQGEVVAFQTTDVPADVKTNLQNWKRVV